MKEVRLLKANEIDVRVGSINEKGATLLLYKDARVDMNVLDETFGAASWQRKHYELKGHIYCSVGINLNDQWVWKDDVGTESVSEATKGESSDSFKRACFNWGIGRELYTAPFTWISADNYTSFKNPKTGKLGTYDKFIVDKIDYDENREINQLVIKNGKTGKAVFTMGKTVRPPVDTTKSGADQEIEATVARAKQVINETLESHNYTTPDSKKAFVKLTLGKETIDTEQDANEVMDALENES